jgi:hypothetical protein
MGWNKDSGKEPFDFDCRAVKETDAAILVDTGDEETWIPKSQIIGGDVHEEGDEGTMVIPEWLAIERGLA